MVERSLFLLLLITFTVACSSAAPMAPPPTAAAKTTETGITLNESPPPTLGAPAPAAAATETRSPLNAFATLTSGAPSPGARATETGIPLSTFDTQTPFPTNSCAGTIRRYSVCEITFTYSSAGLVNPWENVVLAAEFTTPSHRILDVNGFYYDQDTYKVRFTPAEVGNYTYKVTISGGPSGTLADTLGSFVSEPVATFNNGFLRRSPDNPYRFVTEGDGAWYNGIGLNDCWVPNPPWNLGNFIDSGVVVDTDTYFRTFAEAGFNLFRWNPGNCSFGIYKVGSTAVNYDLNGGKSGDRLLSTAKKYGFHILFTFFMSPPAQLETTLSEGEKLAIHYAIARYGPYVDLWEMTNETGPDSINDSWMRDFVNYVHSQDPYRRMVTNSNPREPGARSAGDWTILNFRSPHWGVTDGFADMVRFSNQFTTGEGVLIGEGYNVTNHMNWTPQTDDYLRIAQWTSLISGMAIAYWNSSGKVGQTPNMYLGEKERAVVRGVQNFFSAFSTNLHGNLTPSKLGGLSLTTGQEDSGTLAYDLKGENKVLIYLYHNFNRAAPAWATVINGYDVPFNSTGTWLDPQTGNILQSVTISSGRQNIVTPSFIVDTALVITE